MHSCARAHMRVGSVTHAGGHSGNRIRTGGGRGRMGERQLHPGHDHSRQRARKHGHHGPRGCLHPGPRSPVCCAHASSPLPLPLPLPLIMPPVLSASLLPMCVGGREYETCDAIYKTPHPIDKRVHAACGMRHAGFDNGIRQGVDTSFRSFIDVSGL